MKTRPLNYARLSIVSGMAMLLAAPSASAVVWDGGGGNGNWGNGTNWSTNTVPGAGNLIEFNSTSGTVTSIYISAARTVAGINFLSGNSAAQNIKLSTQPNATGLAANLTFTSTNTGITVNDGFSHTVGAFGSGLHGDIVLAGGLAVATTSGNLTINRPITDGASSFGLTKTGSGTLTLSSSNTYDGLTNINAGKVIVTDSIGSSAVSVAGAGTILASDIAATIGSTLTVGAGAILAVGDAANATTATATVGGATTFDNTSIFSWDINTDGTAYDKLVTVDVLGEIAAGDAVFRIVANDATFADGFWDMDRTWTDIFTTNGSSSVSNWANVFGNSVSVVDSSLAPITPMGGSFMLSGSTLAWTAVPEPSSTYAGIVLAASLLRRRRQG